MKTVITHFYNEEYLLPWWLEHHKKYFDFGILIDYRSTDRSVEICKEICPHWQVHTSVNSEFDALNCDLEVMCYERHIQGYRIALTTTEFLVGNVDSLFLDTTARVQWYIPGIRFTQWSPYGSLDTKKLLWEQLHNGVHYNTDPWAHQCRSLHNFNDIKYDLGRHCLPHNTEAACVFHYAHCLVGEPMFKRRLQIQHKMSLNDKINYLGSHHFYNIEEGLNIHNLYEMHYTYITDGESDCSEYIARFTKK
jgi:hypothetical protein